MANKIRIYVFGIPDGFDIYQEYYDAEINAYYQCFYDESIKENTRFTIHRKSNGEITYTLLKYHLFSSASRPNAFFGLSVMFEDGYYADVSSLYNLLDYVYRDIVEKGVILGRTQNGNSIHFIPQNFSSVSAEVKDIESYLINTLGDPVYSAEFKGFDSTFGIGKQNAMLKIPFQIYDDADKEKEVNRFVIEELKLYSWLSLSPDYISPETSPDSGSSEPEEILDPATKQNILKRFEHFQGQVLAAYKRAQSGSDDYTADANRLLRDVQGIVSTLKNYLNHEPDLDEIYHKYSGLARDLKDLISNETKSSGPNPDPGPGGIMDLIKRFLKEYGKAASFIVIACVAVVLIFSLRPKPKPNDPSNNTGDSIFVKPTLAELVDNFQSCLSSNNYEAAAEIYENVRNDYESEGLRKLRILDNQIKVTINDKLSTNAFDDAWSCQQKLSSTNIGSELDRMIKENFRKFIQTNIRNVQMKDHLLAEIKKAKTGGYHYEGIDQDEQTIQNLGGVTPPLTYTLIVKNVEKPEEGPVKYNVSRGSTVEIPLKVKILYELSIENAPQGYGFRIMGPDAIGMTIDFDKAKNGYVIFPETGKSRVRSGETTDKDKTLGMRYADSSGSKVFGITIKFKER